MNTYRDQMEEAGTTLAGVVLREFDGDIDEAWRQWLECPDHSGAVEPGADLFSRMMDQERGDDAEEWYFSYVPGSDRNNRFFWAAFLEAIERAHVAA